MPHHRAPIRPVRTLVAILAWTLAACASSTGGNQDQDSAHDASDASDVACPDGQAPSQCSGDSDCANGYLCCLYVDPPPDYCGPRFVCSPPNGPGVRCRTQDAGLPSPPAMVTCGDHPCYAPATCWQRVLTCPMGSPDGGTSGTITTTHECVDMPCPDSRNPPPDLAECTAAGQTPVQYPVCY